MKLLYFYILWQTTRWECVCVRNIHRSFALGAVLAWAPEVEGGRQGEDEIKMRLSSCP